MRQRRSGRRQWQLLVSQVIMKRSLIAVHDGKSDIGDQSSKTRIENIAKEQAGVLSSCRAT